MGRIGFVELGQVEKPLQNLRALAGKSDENNKISQFFLDFRIFFYGKAPELLAPDKFVAGKNAGHGNGKFLAQVQDLVCAVAHAIEDDGFGGLG